MPGLEIGNDADLVGVAKVLGCKDTAALAELRPSGLMKLTQRELLEAAKVLRLTKVTRLNKEALLARVWEALQKAGAIPFDEQPAPLPRKQPAPTPQPSPSTNGHHKQADAAPVATARAPSLVPPAAPEEPAVTPPTVHKFDVGQGTKRGTPQDFSGLRAEAQTHIPWSYAHNKVTALPVDPDRLFVYWEVLQTAVEQARGALGPGGKDAWLSLRVYDVTGRIFDGSNAHSYFDQGVGNDVRQWFFEIGKPTSQVVVEVGLKSHEGFFVKIARSGRCEFPRREPVAWSDPEWMTVQVSSGVVAEAGRGLSLPAGDPAGGPGPGPGPGRGEPVDFASHAISFDSGPGLRRRIWVGRHRELGFEGDVEVEDSWSWEEVDGDALSPEVLQAFAWEGDTELTSWESGPFDYPVEIPALVKETFSGPTRIFRTGGRTHVVWGPWQVVIRGLGAHAERRVISRWQVERAFTTKLWREITTGPMARPAGSSGQTLGASERWGRAGSELRLGGASERFTVGASELRFGGASERAYAGASQWVYRGASERRFRGASESLLRGASERRLAGASELRLGGASELRLGGASEGRLGFFPVQAGPGGEPPPDPLPPMRSAELEHPHNNGWPELTPPPVATAGKSDGR